MEIANGSDTFGSTLSPGKQDSRKASTATLCTKDDSLERETIDAAPSPDSGDSRKTSDPEVGAPTPSESKQARELSDPTTRWDYGPCCAPKFCNMFNRIEWVVVFWGIAGFLQSGCINGSVNAVLASIQLRYQITNVQLGILIASYDVITIIVVAFTAYYGARGRTPRWIGTGILLLGLASFAFALPQLMFGTYQYSFGAGEPTCNDNSTSTCFSTSSGQNSFWIFLASQILAGVGASPLYTIGITYLEENAGPKASSLCIGIFMTMTVIGPAVGFVVTGILLNSVYVDVPISPKYTSSSPLWIGAWWLPFLCYGCLLLVAWIPILGYPEMLPKAKSRLADSSEANANMQSDRLKGIRKTTKTVAKCSTVWLLSICTATRSYHDSIFSSFGSKFIELAFGVPFGSSAILVGGVYVSGAAVGMFTGGLVLKLRKLNMHEMLLLLIATSSICLPVLFCLLMGCSRPVYAGVTHTYPNYSYVNSTLYWSTPVAMQTPNLNSSCNNNCSCSATSYEPLCGSDGVLYYSPCYAGCQFYSQSGTIKVYYPCSCIQPSSSKSASIFSSSYYFAAGNVTSFATTDTASCVMSSSNISCSLPLFMVCLFLIAALDYLPDVANVKVLLGCVPPECASVSLAVNTIVARAFGYIPGSLLGGLIFDQTCLFWQRTGCFQDPSCLQYDLSNLSYWLLLVVAGVQVVRIICSVLARIMFKLPLDCSQKAADDTKIQPQIGVTVSCIDTDKTEDLAKPQATSAQHLTADDTKPL